ncbi:MAG: class I SAM-dependent methyltransferase [Pirellulales bacterium]|nr:class I SAM-dependent methyltransferase [Pirellulales bacterium]
MTTATAADTSTSQAAAFDAYAAQYESALQNGLWLSGEGPEYFARRRIAWTAELLRQEEVVNNVLDFGCGVGIATSLLQELLTPRTIWGFDPSSAAIARADKEFGSEFTHFTAVSDEIPSGRFDLAYCNGVFHHIEPSDRAEALAVIWRALRPGGWFAFWENNPWNPGTRYVMSRIPFDCDAVTISPTAANRLLQSAGFLPTRTDAWFLFPRSLSWLRPLERLVHRLPLGGQYLVFAQKPAELEATDS